ncbi:MAG: ACT domain-containing protein [Candidatus Excrementavichristensenella sp.]|nr:ACT domain-containing protein [Bacillota bacterium]NLL53611.1 ACT domain-containing protein [Clostridiales bacterium]
MSKAVVTVLGFDRKGIIARVSTILYERGINILDISQTVLDGYFNMVMMVDISEPVGSFSQLSDELNALGEELGLQIRIQKSEIFEAMHQV